MLLMADYKDIGAHHHFWGVLLPPEACVQQLFVTKEGMSVVPAAGAATRGKQPQEHVTATSCVRHCALSMQCPWSGQGVKGLMQ